MRRRALLLPLLLVPALFAEEYTIGPDSQRQAGVPVGKVTKHTWTSRIFPGTVRDYWVYVPAQYDAAKPACLMIFQDGGGMVSETSGFRAPIVMDNLIAQQAMPVTIGIFINPGVLPAASPDQQDRYNRSYEYDGLGDTYARFLIEEIIPEVGKQYRFSSNPNDRALAGSSSGGIAAFTAAWERPDQFRRVLSFIGSYTNLRGGDVYPGLIRKMEPLPLRVFLQDGRNDQNIYSGSWYLANQSMASALQYAGYESEFVVGSEGHNGKHGSAILPDAMRWLWKGWPNAVQRSTTSNGTRHYITMFLDPASDWEAADQMPPDPIRNSKGESYYPDRDGKRIWFQDATGRKRVVHPGVGATGPVAFSADESLLLVADSAGRVVWSFQIQPDGALANGQPFYHLELPDGLEPGSLRTSAGGMAVDTEGYLYVATNMGIQICDQPGRVVGIIRKPDSSTPTRVVFGGPDRQTLYVASGNKIYRRHLRRTGVQAGVPVKPPKPQL